MTTSSPTAPAANAPRAESSSDFVLVSIDRSAGPEGSEGNWVHYKIAQGPNVVSGYRRGTIAIVKAHVEAIVCALNDRRALKRGRVNLTTIDTAETGARDQRTEKKPR